MVDLLVDEVRHADLGDERLNERLIRIVERFGESPNLSIPAATTSRAEMEAAYRFFSNSRVSSQKILAPHAAQTLRRMAEQSVVLMVQDTTEIDLTRPSQPVKGAGPMDCEKRRGEFFHPLIAFASNGIPLGIVWHKLWAREKIETNATREEKKTRRDEIPIEDKESIRWLEGLRAARKAAAECPQTTCVCVSDSESDVYELFSEPRLEPAASSEELVYQSLTRFDQQVTTKPHRDGGPDESILMLGYEPTLIESRLEMSDYSKCAHDLGMAPAEFLDQFNPMFPDGRNRLTAYTTAIVNFDNSSFQILLINNSMNRIGEGLVGVLHTARIINPNPDLSRIVNSTMIASVPQGHGESISVNEQNDFVTSAVVHRAVYA